MEEKERIRKAGRKAGQTTQKMMAFRVDNEVAEILATVANKGRLLNELVKDWAAAHKRLHDGPDYPPEDNNIPLSDEQ